MDRLYIAIAVHNRMAIAEQCVPTVRAGMALGSDVLALYDDGSTEKMGPRLMASASTMSLSRNIGINAQRRKHFMDFWARVPDFTHLYLCDSDAPHDPEWRSRALALQAEHKAPVCLYRTETHAKYPDNIFRDDPGENVIWQRWAPGVSYLLTKEHVREVMKHLAGAKQWDWDWAVPAILGNRMAVSRVSYVDHIGMGGMHDKPGDPDHERASNPTPWLVEKRKEIITCLT